MLISEGDIYPSLGPRKVKVKRGSKEGEEFVPCRKVELDGLLEDSILEPVAESEITGNSRIFGSRFADELKRMGDLLKRKSRLVARNYSESVSDSDTDAGTISKNPYRPKVLTTASTLPGRIPHPYAVVYAGRNEGIY